LIVRASKFAGGGELGLFAAQQFNPGQIITAYAGVPTVLIGDDSRKAKLGKYSVDVPCLPDRSRVLYFGGYCCNSPY